MTQANKSERDTFQIASVRLNLIGEILSLSFLKFSMCDASTAYRLLLMSYCLRGEIQLRAENLHDFREFF